MLTLVFLLVGAVPLLPLCLRPLREHRRPGVRLFGRALAMLLLWVGFNVSLMTIWGAVRYVPEGWIALVAVLPVQVIAARASYRVAFDDADRRDGIPRRPLL